MALKEFIVSLREASRLLSPPDLDSGFGSHRDSRMSAVLNKADLWLTPDSVKGFDPSDFGSLPSSEFKKLEIDIAEFRGLAEQVKDGPARRHLSKKARAYLENVINIVRRPLLDEWLEAQSWMISEAEIAAQSKGWYSERDEKFVAESLLGRYRSPRLRIKSLDAEVVFDPIARFGGDGRGVVDLVALPTYETAYYVTWKNDLWWIAAASDPSPRHARFSQRTVINAVLRVAKR